MLPKSLGNSPIKLKLCIIIPSFHCLSWNSCLGHGYSDPSVIPWFHVVLEVSKYKCSKHLLQFASMSSTVSKWQSFNWSFIWGEWEKKHGEGQVNKVSGEITATFLETKNAEQLIMCEQMCCGGEPGYCSLYIQQLCDCTNIIDCLPTICNNCLLYFPCFLVLWLSIVILNAHLCERLSSILKAFVPQKGFTLIHSFVTNCVHKHAMDFCSSFF